MHNLLGVFRLALNEFRKWVGNKRMIALGLMMFVTLHSFVWPLRHYCHGTGVRTSPFIFPHLTTNNFVVSIFLFLAVILFCNAPFMDNLSTYEIARSGRMRWFASKVLYIFLASFVFVVILYSATLLVVGRYIVWIDEWGRVITVLSRTDAGFANHLVYFNNYILSNYRPIQATILTFVMLWLQVALVGMIILAANLVARRSRFVGVVLAAMYASSPLAFGFYENANMVSFLPATWTVPYFLKPNVEGVLVTYTSAFYLMALFIVVLSFVSWLIFRKRDMEIYLEI